MKLSQPLSRVFATLLISLLACSLQAETLRIAAWNIEWFPGQRMHDVSPSMERAHMQRVQNTLKAINPDLLLASEIRNWHFFDDLVSVVPGLKPCVVSSFRDRDQGILWSQQVAIATKWPVVAAWHESWKPPLTALNRGFSFAALAAPGNEDKVILVYALHLKSNRAWNEAQTLINYRMRDESIAQLLAHLDEMERLTFRDRIVGVIVGGDINTNHDGQFDDNVVRLLEEAGFHNTWDGVKREDRLTWAGSREYPPTTLDYIFTRGLPKATAKLIEVPRNTSDHHAVILELEL